MGNEATKLEISIDGDEPFKPGDQISGEVVLTTPKPLKLKQRISGIMDIKFEGRTWKNGSDCSSENFSSESIEHVNKLIKRPMPISDKAYLPLGTYRFEFTFEIPKNSPSTIVFSHLEGTNYNITAIFQGHNMATLATAKRELTILAPPKLPSSDESNGNNEPESGEAAGRTYCAYHEHLPMHFQLRKRIFKPGEVIPISGEFNNCSDVPLKIKAAITNDDYMQRWFVSQENCILAEAEYPVIMQPWTTMKWKDEEFFRLPTTIPTESSLVEPFRNRRHLVVMVVFLWNTGPTHLQLELPIQIEG